MKKFSKAFAVGVLAVAGSAFAHASTISYSTPVSSQPITFSANALLQKFDGSLGTLTDIALTANGSFVLTLNVQNQSTTQTEGYSNAKATATADIFGPNGLDMTIFAQTSGKSNAAIGPGVQDTYPGLAASGSATADLTDSANLAAFTGTGGTFLTLTFTADPLQTGGSSVGNDIFYNASGSASGSIGVVYTYTAAPPVSGTPEPATMALMGSALLGLGLLGKRFRA